MIIGPRDTLYTDRNGRAWIRDIGASRYHFEYGHPFYDREAGVLVPGIFCVSRYNAATDDWDTVRRYLVRR